LKLIEVTLSGTISSPKITTSHGIVRQQARSPMIPVRISRM
jgi:hypothetical protein